jgi:hypothetical protein
VSLLQRCCLRVFSRWCGVHWQNALTGPRFAGNCGALCYESAVLSTLRMTGFDWVIPELDLFAFHGFTCE